MIALLRCLAILVVLASAVIGARAFAPMPTVPPHIEIGRNDAGLHALFTGGLQAADTPSGPWRDLVDAVSPFAIPTNRPSMMFRAVDKENQMKIIVGSTTYIVSLENNPSARALKAMLPITLDMKELNGNEKYSDLPASLPVDPANPGTIRSGDLMLYGDRVLVLFYETFSTSYRYTKLGRIETAAGLAAAVGAGEVKIALELE